MPDRDAGADRLQRDVHRAGQPGRIRRLDHLVIGGPQRQPRRTGGRSRPLQAVQHGAAGHEFLTRGRACAGQVGRADGGEVRAMQRGAQGDDPAGLDHAVVVHVPQPGHHAPGRVADHGHRAGARSQRLVHVPVQHVRLHLEVAGAVTGQLDHDGAPAGGRDLASQDGECGGAPAVAGDQQHVARMVLIGAGDGGARGQRAYRASDGACHDDQGQDGDEHPAPAAQAAPPGDRAHSPMVRPVRRPRPTRWCGCGRSGGCRPGLCGRGPGRGCAA